MFRRFVAQLTIPKPWFWGFALTVVGMLVTLVFQIVAARLIGPDHFAEFASFLALVNIGAIGAGALQNSVAIRVASQGHHLDSSNNYLSRHSTLLESAILGFIALAIALSFSPLIDLLTGSSGTSLFAAAITFPLSFLFSRNLGVLQGNSKSIQTLWLSTAGSVVRLALFLCMLPILGALPTSISSVVLGLGIICLVSFVLVSKIKERGSGKPFTQKSLIVIVNTIIFAWLTNSDVIFFKNLTDPQTASDYSVASIFIKAALVIPGTISIFLLPKLAQKSAEEKNSDNSFKKSTIITFASGILISIFLLVAGGMIIEILFGNSYSLSNQFVCLVSLSFLPWMMAQNELMRTNTNAYKKETALLVLFALLQAVLFVVILPNVVAAICSNFLVGTITFVVQRIVAQSRQLE